MKGRILILPTAVLLLAAGVAGCAPYPSYGYSYAPPGYYSYYPYGYASAYPGTYAYPHRPFYSPDYYGYFHTGQISGGGNS
jgi:hypothetical protein